MDVDLKKEDIVACHRVGDPKKKPRPMLIRCVTRDLKLNFFTNKKKLKDDISLGKVYINEDLTVLKMKRLQYVRKLDNLKAAFTRDGKVQCMREIHSGEPR